MAAVKLLLPSGFRSALAIPVIEPGGQEVTGGWILSLRDANPIQFHQTIMQVSQLGALPLGSKPIGAIGGSGGAWHGQPNPVNANPDAPEPLIGTTTIPDPITETEDEKRNLKFNLQFLAATFLHKLIIALLRLRNRIMRL